MKASRPGARLIVERRGLCSSNADMTDYVAPVLPEVLGCPPEKVSLRALCVAYFRWEQRGKASFIRFSPRLEYGLAWDELRSKGDCALTPDERSIYSSILSARPSLSPIVTDFPLEGSDIRRVGHRQYYQSRPSPSEAASTLRGIGSRGERNSYLPRGSTVSLGLPVPSTSELLGLFRALGDWCFLVPE